jgi:hypothetical protein
VLFAHAVTADEMTTFGRENSHARLADQKQLMQARQVWFLAGQERF